MDFRNPNSSHIRQSDAQALPDLRVARFQDFGDSAHVDRLGIERVTVPVTLHRPGIERVTVPASRHHRRHGHFQCRIPGFCGRLSIHPVDCGETGRNCCRSGPIVDWPYFQKVLAGRKLPNIKNSSVINPPVCLSANQDHHRYHE